MECDSEWCQLTMDEKNTRVVVLCSGSEVAGKLLTCLGSHCRICQTFPLQICQALPFSCVLLWTLADTVNLKS